MAKIFGKDKKPALPKTRKQIRKEKRQQKKQARNERYLKKTKGPVVPDPINSSKPNPKSSKQHNNEASVQPSTIDLQIRQNEKDAQNLKKLQKQMQMQRIRQLQEANVEEDREIRDLEKKLKLNRRKSKSLPKSFVEDGLDYLLEVCDYNKYKDSINFEKELNASEDEFEDDLAEVTGTGISKPEYKEEKKIAKKSPTAKPDISSRMKKLQAFINAESSDGELQDVTNDDNVESSDDERQDVTSDDNAESEDERQDIASDDTNSDYGSDDADGHPPKRMKLQVENESKNLREDIYGRLRDEEGNIVQTNTGKYMPPQLRTHSQDSNKDSEMIQRLNKQMKGYLNRLTEQNMHSIVNQMENLYMEHSRNDTNYVFMKLIMESMVSPILSPERMVIEHALLISILHANIGTEIGAYILQNLIEELHKMLQEDCPVENKRIDNVTVLLCQLYNFKVFNCSLIYELLNKFVDKFQEKHVELILIVLKNIGFRLRKDDPTALKEFIISVQKKANESTALKESSRVRFMLDTLSAVKNNNMLKVQNYDPSYVEHLKKIGKALLRPGKFVTELKISIDDLLNAETRGKWWIIGSAWSGDFGKNAKNDESTIDNKQFSFDHKILELARKQRMNTEARKNIFCILMTAEDYIDAFAKLMKLDLKGQQYREIMHVLMHCLMKEKRYNPYYAFLANQFCSTDRKYQVINRICVYFYLTQPVIYPEEKLAIQFCSWDKFKEISTFSNQQITNLAKFLAYLFVERQLPLSILKTLQFTEMNKPMVKLIRQILLAVLLVDDETVVSDVFSRIAKSEKLFMLREGLQLFLHHFVLKNVGKGASEESEKKLDMLSKRIELAVNSLQGTTFDF